MAAQGVHASPKVTASCHTDGCLSFLTEAAFGALQRGWSALCTRKQLDISRTGPGQLCSAVEKEDPPSSK